MYCKSKVQDSFTENAENKMPISLSPQQPTVQFSDFYNKLKQVLENEAISEKV